MFNKLILFKINMEKQGFKIHSFACSDVVQKSDFRWKKLYLYTDYCAESGT